MRDAIDGACYAGLSDAGHVSPLTHPESVARVVASHLERVAPNPRPPGSKQGDAPPMS